MFRAGPEKVFPGMVTWQILATEFEFLLEQYYDPMYLYQIEKKQPEIIFEGPEAEFLQWAEDYSPVEIITNNKIICEH